MLLKPCTFAGKLTTQASFFFSPFFPFPFLLSAQKATKSTVIFIVMLQALNGP